MHTKLLSGSLNSELDLTPAQRRKALAGRVLEAAGKTKLGKGESAVRAKERNKAAKHIRDGLIAKQKERSQKQLEEVCPNAFPSVYDQVSTLLSHRRSTWAIITLCLNSCMKLAKRRNGSPSESED